MTIIDQLFTSLNNTLVLVLGIGVLFLIIHFIIQAKANKKRRKIAELKERIHAKLNLDEAAKAKLKEFGNSAAEAAFMSAAASGVSLFEIYANSDGHRDVMKVLEFRDPHSFDGNLIEHAAKIADADDSQLTAWLSHFKGQEAENIALDNLRSQGLDANLFDSLTNPTNDIFVTLENGEKVEYSVKCGDLSYIKDCIENSGADHFIINSEAYDKLQHSGMLQSYAEQGIQIIDGGFSDAQLEAVGENALNAMGDGLDATDSIPAIAAIIFGLKSVRNLTKLGTGKQTVREAGINIGLDFARIGVGGAGAYGLGKIGALAGSMVFPGVGTLVGGGIGIFAGSLMGSQMINFAKERLKWGRIFKAQDYFGGKLVSGESPEFIDNFTEGFFEEESLRARLSEEKLLLEEHGDELDIYKSKEVSVQAVLVSEYVEYLETMLKKTEYVRKNLLNSIMEVCNTLTSTMSSKKAEVNSTRLAGELVLQNSQYLLVSSEETGMLEGYKSQQANSKDYPTRFESDENVLETIAMQLFNKCVIAAPKSEQELKNTAALTIGLLCLAAVMGIFLWKNFF